MKNEYFYCKITDPITKKDAGVVVLAPDYMTARTVADEVEDGKRGYLTDEVNIYDARK